MPRQITDSLREAGHSVESVSETNPGIGDTSVLSRAAASDAVLLTSDKDFGELVFRQKRLTKGVILIRLRGISPELKGEIVLATVKEHHEQLADSFTVVSAGTVRIRRSTGR